MPVSLYVHIPFCVKRCIYCDFVSGIYSPEKEAAYLETLKKEILNVSKEPVFSTLYIGGGTPTVLSTEGITDLIRHIFKNLSFAENYEATIEANPGTINSEKLNALFSSGINRISIGVQSFNDSELNFLGRIHKSDEAEEAVLLAKKTGLKNIGIDLIYGIPGQDIESWKRTLQKTVSLKPTHISTYELTVEEGTVLYEYMGENIYAENNTGSHENQMHAENSHSRISGKPDSLLSESINYNELDSCLRRNDKKRQKRMFSEQNKLKSLDEDKIIEMYDYAIDFLKSQCFMHYEISNFALPDYFCRHNVNYWDRGEYCGAGLAAHSFINGKRFYNTDNLKDYVKTILSGKTPVRKSEDITGDKALSEAIFLGLRKTQGVNLEEFGKKYGRDLLAVCRKEIKELQEAGLIEIADSNLLRLTRKGILLSNEVFVKFM
ncbi:MAG: radical SAM family heme chaperone HemW [Nitrospirae bacterium]|nr:radical SAM family heme chaperone HemW [Nitrospirota bacterium]